MNDKLNFLPADYLERKSQQQTNIFCLFLFVLVIGGVGAGYYYTQGQVKAMSVKTQAVNKEMARASETLNQLELLEKRKEQMMSKAAISAMLMEPVPRTLLLALMTNELPAGVSLTKYTLETNEVVVKNPRVEALKKKKKLNKKEKEELDQLSMVPNRLDTSIEITGLARTDLEVAQLIDGLSKASLFDKVDLNYSEEHEFENQIMRRYQLRLKLHPEARASHSDVEMARRSHVSGM